MRIRLLMIIFGISLYGAFSCAENETTSTNTFSMKERIAKVKKSTVRILINSKPVGSGFVISEDGLIATCFHVVQQIKKDEKGQPILIYASNIEVEFSNGDKYPANVHKSCQDKGMIDAFKKDYCILEIKASKKLQALSLGNFDEAFEGSSIYLSGFPMGINKPFISFGFLSTKAQTNIYQNESVESAWLDITMNQGNSGSPIMLIGKNVKDDKVICIASFALNPYSPYAKQLINIVQNFPATITLSGVNFKDFATLVALAIESNSYGINGCISIDYLRMKLK